MTIPLVQQGFQRAKKMLALQGGAVLLLSLGAWWLQPHAALAVACGGLAVIGPQLVFTLLAFSRSGARASKQVVRRFYLGESLKLILSAGLLVAAFVFLPGLEVVILAGYVVALLCQWLSPFVVKIQ